MKPIDIIIIVLAVAIVVGALALALWRKKTGKSGCGCGCNGCKGCADRGECPTLKKAQEEADEEVAPKDNEQKQI